MRSHTRRLVAAALCSLAVLSTLAACSDDGSGVVTSSEPSATASANPSAASGSASGTGTSTGSLGYAPVSSVDAHEAIGEDIADMKDLMAKPPVDWAAVAKAYREGGASKRSDGTTRTLATLMEAPDVTAVIDAALAGSGSPRPSDVARAQTVEKALVVLLARKMLDELAAAADNVTAGKTGAADGAPHNVDEAFAFFAAKGNGPATTAQKRAADFGRGGKVLEPIVTALKAAQKTALDGDKAGLSTATTAVREGLNYVFYLATYKYLTGATEKERAEGAGFYLGIRPVVARADAEADRRIRAALTSGSGGEAARAALNDAAVLQALDVDADERVGAADGPAPAGTP